MADMISSALKRGSAATVCRNRKYACGFNWWAGPAGTTVRGPAGCVRKELVWQNAQLMATRGPPNSSDLENPTGSS